MTRLTDQDRRFRAMTEAELQRLVTDLADIHGWAWSHFRPAQTKHGGRPPVSGSLGKGWPDLTLVRARDRRLLFVELKREHGLVDADQAAVLAILGELRHPLTTNHAGMTTIAVHVWRPSDLGDPIETGRVMEVLR